MCVLQRVNERAVGSSDFRGLRHRTKKMLISHEKRIFRKTSTELNSCIVEFETLFILYDFYEKCVVHEIWAFFPVVSEELTAKGAYTNRI